MVPQSQRKEQLFTLTQGPCLCEPRRTITPGERTPPGGSPASGKAVALTLRAPCLSAPSEPLSQAPLPDPGDHRRSPVSAVGAAPSSLGVSAPGRVAVPAPSLPGSGSGPRSEPRRRGLSFSVPALSLSRPGPRSPCARYSPPTRYMLAAMAVPAASSGRTKGTWRLGGVQSSARGEARSAGLALHGSLGRAHAAGTSAASAVAVHLGPRCRRGCYRLTPGAPRPAPVSSAPSGTSSAPDDAEPGSGVPHPLKAPADVGLCRRRRRLALPASGFASFRNTFGRSGEQGPALGSGRRERPHGSATSGSASAPSGQPRPRARLFPLQLGPASDAGRSWASLTLWLPEPCLSAYRRGRSAPVRSARLFASGFACHLHEWSTLPHPFRALFFHPHPQRAPKAPSRAPQKDWEATLL